MTVGRKAVQVALADLRRRLRSPKYLVIPVLIAWFAQSLTSDTTQLVVAGEYTGVQNAAWFGGMVATMGTFLLFVFGFTLVRGAVTREDETGVGELVATSPISNGTYLVGRWLGYLLLLTLVTALLALATVAAYALHGTGTFDFWALASPFVFLTLPAMTLVAAVAVLTETFRSLRGTLGSVLYFFGALGAFGIASLGSSVTYGPTGLAVVRNSMVEAAGADPTVFENRSFAFTGDPGSVTMFTWNGIEWGAAELLSRGPTLAAAGIGLVGAAVAFDRFEPSPGILERITETLFDKDRSQTDEDGTTNRRAPADEVTTHPSEINLQPVSPSPSRVPGRRMLTAEMRIALRGQRWWWYLGVGSCIVAGLLTPIRAARSFVLPVAWLFGLSVWAGLGVREQRYRTSELVFTSAYPLRQLAATYIGGVSIALLSGAGVLVALVLAGEFTTVGAVFIGACFIPALAITSGVLLGTSRVFEVLFLSLWYLGPMNAVYSLDFIPAHPETVARGTPIWIAIATVLLLIAAAVGRSRKTQK
ncbi:ABC transporter permease subunit [Halorubrum sp. 2020YC2]|uniref:ABC transporter permease subunit n=1 Tax=Halorubrum sp. 2020YC2 TaxID=2836432 RepID=UPI001BE7B696|nr:ABC transporter permease subunit [Halorubrum sp. 2020YC2]QWC18446.1 ABC transporter permease subunit [Halorubrum sp. 2020YC2]